MNKIDKIQQERFFLTEFSKEAQKRYYPENKSKYRSEFHRDRDRIIHSTAFRRLNGKTQVIINPKLDHYRTRLTHSIEVAQIAKTLAMILNLDQELSETVALSHDLGHPPFGHIGENFLSEKMENKGGFSHNGYSFVLVNFIEEKYPNFVGLNLCSATLDAILKHNGRLIEHENYDLRKILQKLSIPYESENILYELGINLHENTNLEGQIAAISDDIAYNSHDIDDAFRGGFINISDLISIPLIGDIIKDIKNKYPHAQDKQIITLAVSELIGEFIDDIFHETTKKIANLGIKNVADVKKHPDQIVKFSAEFENYLKEIRSFLFDNYYQNKEIICFSAQAKDIIFGIFDFFLKDFEKIPNNWRNKFKSFENIENQAKIICYYIAGMTDNYAIDFYEKYVNNRY